MLTRVKDLRTTLPGLIVGLALIAATLAAMKLHPEWTWQDIVGLIGGIAVIVLGALSRSSGPEAPKPPEGQA